MDVVQESAKSKKNLVKNDEQLKNGSEKFWRIIWSNFLRKINPNENVWRVL